MTVCQMSIRLGQKSSGVCGLTI